jgi:hypothetical protein
MEIGNIEENKLSQLLNKEEQIDLKLSYSRISDFDRNGPKALIRPSNPDGNGLRFGSLCDDLLVDRVTGNNVFKETYVIYDDNKPTATLGSLCDIVLENYDTVPDKETILKIVKHNAFWSNIKLDETLVKKFDLPEFWNYVKIKSEIRDKVVVTQRENDDAQECVSLLLNHKHTTHLFNNTFENHYQYTFTYEYGNFTLRGIIDKMSIDHSNKIVYMEDIKTGSSRADEFTKSFIKYCYYFQEAVYVKAFDSICRKLNLINYQLAPFKFIFIGRGEKVPHVFEISDKWHNAAINGFTTKAGYKYKGLDENLDLIYYHWKNKLYDFSREVYRSNGNLILNDDFIEVN